MVCSVAKCGRLAGGGGVSFTLKIQGNGDFRMILDFRNGKSGDHSFNFNWRDSGDDSYQLQIPGR